MTGSELSAKEPTLWTSGLGSRFAEFVSQARTDLLIVAPFITRNALESIVDNLHGVLVTVVTTWTPGDVLRGASDPQIYPYLRARNWRLRLHRRVHAKLLLRDRSWLVVSTANITQAGLGTAEPSNVECAVPISALSLADQLWIFSLLASSSAVNDVLYQQFVRICAEDANRSGNEARTSLNMQSCSSPADSIPVTLSPHQLISNLQTLEAFGLRALGRDSLQATLHDASLYSLSPIGARTMGIATLRTSFFSSSLAKGLIDFVAGGRFFGELKSWLRTQCRTLGFSPPADLTHCVQVLVNWLVELEPETFLIERPHYSQRIVPAHHATPRSTFSAFDRVPPSLYRHNDPFNALPYRSVGY